MAARGMLARVSEDAEATRPAKWSRSLVHTPEYLALAALIVTIFLLGYWRPLPVASFAPGWLTNKQYSLVIHFNNQYQRVALYPSDIGALATVALWLLARLVAAATGQTRAALKIGPLSVTLPLLGLAALSALSATQAIFPPLSIEIALHLLLLAALVIAVINLRPPLWAVVAPLAPLLAIEGVLAVLQARAQSTLLGHFLFNWNTEATAAQSGASVVQLPGGTRWLRAYGSFPHPNILGGFLCLALPLVAGAYLRLPRRSRTAWLLLIALALGALALLLSFSRAAWLGIFLGALWAGVIWWLKRRAARQAIAEATSRPTQANTIAPQSENARSSVAESLSQQGSVPPSPRRMALWRSRGKRPSAASLCPTLLMLLSVGLIVGLVAALGPVVQSRLLLTNASFEQRSVDERIVLIEASAVFLTQHPWLGVGAGNMPLVELSYPPTSSIGEPTHNVPLAIGVDTGIFGLFLWLIPPLVALWVAWRRRRALPPGGLAASAALVALLTAAQLDHYLWTQPTGQMIWWLAVTLVAVWWKDDTPLRTVQ